MRRWILRQNVFLLPTARPYAVSIKIGWYWPTHWLAFRNQRRNYTKDFFDKQEKVPLQPHSWSKELSRHVFGKICFGSWAGVKAANFHKKSLSTKQGWGNDPCRRYCKTWIFGRVLMIAESPVFMRREFVKNEQLCYNLLETVTNMITGVVYYELFRT